MECYNISGEIIKYVLDKMTNENVGNDWLWVYVERHHGECAAEERGWSNAALASGKRYEQISSCKYQSNYTTTEK